MDAHLEHDLIFVGRAREEMLLRPRVEALARGQGALVLVGGDAGIGKSALALAGGAWARAGGAAFAVGRCYEWGVAPAYAPWHDLLADLRAATVLDPAVLPPPFGAGPAVQTAYQLMQTVTALLHATAMGQALMLLLDDLHWAGREALELLDLATRSLERVPLLIVATYRPEALQPGHPLADYLPQLRRNRNALTLHLEGLSLDDTARLIEARLGPCQPALARYLHDRVESNPLFLVELLDDLHARRLLPQDAAGHWGEPVVEIPVPELLQAAIAQRVARLGDDAVALLDVAAVAGHEWELAVVETVLGWPEEQLVRALEEALAGRVIVPAAGGAEHYRFAHGLIQEALYGRHIGRRRRHVHARIGLALEAGTRLEQPTSTEPARLAYHFNAAEDWPKAQAYSLAAGDAARDRYASHAAVHFYQQALAASTRLGTPREAPIALSSLYERLGQAYLVLRQQEQAEAAFAQMLDLARAGDDYLAVGQALCWLSFVHTRLYRMDEARATGEEALRVAEQVGDTRLLALSAWNLGHVCKIAGEPVPAVRHLERAVAVARAGGMRDVLGSSLQHLAQLTIWAGHFAQAERQASEAVALTQASHDALSLGGAYWALGLARGERGRYEAARQALQQGLDHGETSGERHYLVRMLNTMGWLYSELGDDEAARRWNQQALAVSRQHDADRVTEAERYSLLNLATDEVRLGRLDAALEHLHAFERMLDDSEYARLRYLNRYQLVQAELTLARGDNQAALTWAEEAARQAMTTGVRKNLAKGWLLAGQALLALERHREAGERLRRALALADEMEHGSLRWQTRWWLGRCLAGVRQPGAAAELYRQAGAEVAKIAQGLTNDGMRAAFLAAPLVQRLGEDAARLVETPPAPVAQAYPAGLSAREVEVLRLVAQGDTNAAIAETLSISVKTVNAHMTSILNKTACANRAAAASFALRHGLA